MKITRNIQRASVFVMTEQQRGKAVSAGKLARANMRRDYCTENVTRCHRCPENSFCPKCHQINRERIYLGLIRPKYQEDHKNNILYPIPLASTKCKRPERLRSINHSVVTAHIRQLGGGWRQGLASLDGTIVYEGPKTRSMDEAWDYAKSSAAMIKQGLRYELELEAQG